MMPTAPYPHLSQTSEVLGRDWRFLFHLHTISTTISSLHQEHSLFPALPMHFMTTFMSMASMNWTGVAICTGTVAKFISTVATFQNHWPFDEKLWPLL